MGRKIASWIFIVAWCTIIFWQSGKPAVESGKESSFVVNCFNQLSERLSGTDKFTVSETFVRKTGHFMEYLVLGILLFGGYLNRERLGLSVLNSGITGVLYSMSDEFHQYFVPGRSARAFDVMIDSTGLFIGILIIFAYYKRKA